MNGTPYFYRVNASSGTQTGPLSAEVSGTPTAGANVSFAYVKNTSRSVSVIDTFDNTIVDTVTVGSRPSGVAITPRTSPPTR